MALSVAPAFLFHRTACGVTLLVLMIPHRARRGTFRTSPGLLYLTWRWFAICLRAALRRTPGLRLTSAAFGCNCLQHVSLVPHRPRAGRAPGLTPTPAQAASPSVELGARPQSSPHRDRNWPRIDSASSKCRSVENDPLGRSFFGRLR